MSLFKGMTSRAGSAAAAKPVTGTREQLAEIPGKVSAALMMVDNDFIITYVNQPAIDLLNSRAD